MHDIPEHPELVPSRCTVIPSKIYYHLQMQNMGNVERGERMGYTHDACDNVVMDSSFIVFTDDINSGKMEFCCNNYL
jgi:hypothetical protein